MAEKIEKSGLYEAIAKFQKEMPTITKDATNPHYGHKYATLHAVLSAVVPIANKHGLVIIQEPGMKPYIGVSDLHYVSVTTRIIHAKTGEQVASEAGSVTSGDPQKVGSALSYLRRYGISSMLSLSTEEDDDGNAASTSGSKAGKGSESTFDKKEMVMKILDICMYIGEQDEDQAAGILYDLTHWEVDGEVKREGTRKGADLGKYSEAALKTVYGKAKSAKASWEKSHGTEEDQGDFPY